jgi:hypothetical protein
VRGGKPPLRNLHALRNQKPKKQKTRAKKQPLQKYKNEKNTPLRKNKHPPQKKLTFPPKNLHSPPQKTHGSLPRMWVDSEELKKRGKTNEKKEEKHTAVFRVFAG